MTAQTYQSSDPNLAAHWVLSRRLLFPVEFGLGLCLGRVHGPKTYDEKTKKLHTEYISRGSETLATPI